MVYCEWKPNLYDDKLVEGFSFMGSSESVNKSHTENIRDSLNETINKTMMSDEAGIKQTVTLSQDMEFDFTKCDKGFAPVYLEMVKGANEGKKDCVAAVAPNKEAMASCGEVYKIPPAKDITPCKASNISQEMTGNFSNETKITEDTETKVREILKQNLENRLENEEDGLTKSLNTLAKAASNTAIMGSSSSTEDHTVINKTKIVDRVVNMMDQETITQLNSDFAGSQKISASGGTIEFLTQDMTITAVAKLTRGKKVFEDIMKESEKIEKNIEKNKTKGAVDMVEAGADVAKKVSGDAAGVATTGIEGGVGIAKAWIYGVAIIVVIVVVAILWFMLSPAGQNVAETAADTGSSIAKAKTGVQ